MTELPIDENTPRILIVEDEPKLGQLLIDYLRAAGYARRLSAMATRFYRMSARRRPILSCWI